jgi:formamidopyrimidine-DNA glycosylase
MPELPEVESVARSLRPAVVGAKIRAVGASGKKLRRRVDLAKLRSACVGATVLAVERIGKYLLLRLSSRVTVLIHLGMSGNLLLAQKGTHRPPHTHVVFDLGDIELRYVDPRRFGLVRPFVDGESVAELGVLGVDPLTAEFTDAYLAAALARSGRDLKALLMDQGCIAGLGNIYVCEALFLAKLSPRRRTRRVAAAPLRASILKVLKRAIANRGTSFSDYVDANGQPGENEAALQVYGREGEACHRCGTRIRRIVQGGRSTFFCPTCQS